jgi:alkylresorcinol/alkylpyrone synthase
VKIAAVAPAFPDHQYSQAQLLAEVRQQWRGSPHVFARLQSFHARSEVGSRQLALPLERYAGLGSFTERNREYVRCAVDLGERALGAALKQAQLEPVELQHLLFVSTTGIATPSIDARLVNRMRLNPELQRTPIFGLGCAGGVGGLARAAEFSKAHPERNVALLALELCSLTWQQSDLSVANLLASGLFGDGAAAVILSPRARASGPRVVASRSIFYPETEHLTGWNVGSHGLELILSAEVPDLVRRHARQEVDRFLGEQGLARRDIQHWVLHSGGPKVLDALQQTLDLSDRDLEPSWQQLRANGNLSSVSVLVVLANTWQSRQPGPGERALLMATGPGFCTELVLLEW